VDFNNAKFQAWDEVEILDPYTQKIVGKGAVDNIIHKGAFTYRILVQQGKCDQWRNELNELWVTERCLKLINRTVIEMMLCEPDHVQVKPNQLYIFRVGKDCVKCNNLYRKESHGS
jgi:hypothetical protein